MINQDSTLNNDITQEIGPKKLPLNLHPSLRNIEEEIKDGDNHTFIESVIIQKSQDMTAIDSMALKMKKKKRASKNHKHFRLLKQKSRHSYATAGEISKLKEVHSQEEDPLLHKKEQDQEEMVVLMKNKTEEAQINQVPSGIPKLIQNTSSMSTPLLH